MIENPDVLNSVPGEEKSYALNPVSPELNDLLAMELFNWIKKARGLIKERLGNEEAQQT